MSGQGGALWIPAYVGIGSNLNDPLRNVQNAFGALDSIERTRVIRRSRIYRTPPLGPVEQPDFYNAAAGLLTQLEPLTLLRSLKALEIQLGRQVPLVRWGPREIDFDLLAYDSVVLQTAELTLPHAGLLQRAFALLPLADIAPDLRIGSVRVAELAATHDASTIERVTGA